MSQGLKDVIAHTETTSSTKATSPSWNRPSASTSFLPSFQSFSKQTAQTKTKEKSRSHETSSERGVELEFLEYDDEIAENDLCELIDILEKETLEICFTKQVSANQLKWPNWFWKHIPVERRLFNWIMIRNYNKVWRHLLKRKRPKG